MHIKIFVIGLVAVVGITGCSESDFKEAKTRLANAAAALMGKVPQAKNATPALTPAQKKLQESAQLLREMFEVVLLREPYGNEEFASYVNTLSQGGSLEGIYNGFVNAQQYRGLEENSPPADASTLKVFAETVSPLQRELAMSTIRPTDLGVETPFLSQDYIKVFGGASLYKLKRLLGDEALKVLEVKRGKTSGKDDLAVWYSRWVVQMAGKRIDFGLPLRNKADPDFHRQWVKSLEPDVAVDRVDWEVLNRVHRLLNVTEAAANARAENGGTPQKGGASQAAPKKGGT